MCNKLITIKIYSYGDKHSNKFDTNGVIMTNLLLKDIMNREGIDPKSVKLIRHALSDPKCQRYIDNNMIKEYTCIQDKKISTKHDYWMVFISGKGNKAILDSFYKVKGFYPNSLKYMPEGFAAPEDFNGEGLYFDLEKLNTLEDYENRLIIEWNNPRAWRQNGTTDKKILSIQAEKKYPFSKPENIILPYLNLKQIIDDPELYSDWHAALSTIYGIYLITDTECGKHYIGAAYGKDGILGRWKEYIKTKHGGNKKIEELLKKHPGRHLSFQFSILQVLSHGLKEKEVQDIEKNYKDKLLTRKFGYNGN